MSNNNLVSSENKDAKLALRQHYVTPAVDIYEQDGGLTLVAGMPGVNRKQLVIDVERGVLSIEGQTRIEQEGERLFREFAPAGYYRQFRLPDEIDLNKIDAQLKNGVLTLKMPKADTAMPKRIAVKTVH
ncbi:MAG: Hsp20/alpha crystallin family protein [Geopsychrobacter sp.]|nr:Hsp20/alpha crystallin family protein [Geopsychrobacter sp.]